MLYMKPLPFSDQTISVSITLDGYFLMQDNQTAVLTVYTYTVMMIMLITV